MSRPVEHTGYGMSWRKSLPQSALSRSGPDSPKAPVRLSSNPHFRNKMEEMQHTTLSHWIARVIVVSIVPAQAELLTRVFQTPTSTENPFEKQQQSDAKKAKHAPHKLTSRRVRGAGALAKMRQEQQKQTTGASHSHHERRCPRPLSTRPPPPCR